MQLSAYKKKRRLSLSELARLTGASKAAIQRAVNGIPISKKNATLIEAGTKREVPAVGLVFPAKVIP